MFMLITFMDKSTFAPNGDYFNILCNYCMVVFLAGNISSSPEHQHHHRSGGHEHSHGANEHGHTHEFMSNPGLWTDRDKIVNRSDWKQVSLNLLLQNSIPMQNVRY